jgi:transcriptional regulator with XRE-family HTH domain
MANAPLHLPGLRAARTAAGLSQEDLAQRAAMSTHSIISYELGRAQASFAVAHLLCELLDVEPSVLCKSPVEVGSDMSGVDLQ